MMLGSLTLDHLLQFPDDRPRIVQVALDPNEGGYGFALYSRPMDSAPGELWPQWTCHATAKLSPMDETVGWDERSEVPPSVSGTPSPPGHRAEHGRLPQAGEGRTPPAVPLDDLQRRCREAVPLAGFYEQLTEYGIRFGPSFQGLAAMWRGSGEALGRVVLTAAVEAQAGQYRFHPALLDACLQVSLDLLDPERQAGGPERFAFLPVGLERVCFFRPPGRELWSHARMRDESGPAGSRRFTIDVDVFDPDGSAVARLEGFSAREIAWAAPGEPLAPGAARQGRAAEGGPAAPPRNIAAESRDQPPDRRRELIVAFLVEEAAKILRLDADQRLHRQRSLFEQGMDSLMSVEFLYRINLGMKVNLPMQRLMETPAIEPLAEALVRQLRAPECTPHAPREVPGKLDAGSPLAEREEYAGPASVWLPAYRVVPAAEIRLFCFPPPGGGAEVFSSWQNALQPSVEVCAVELPGSGARAAEPAVGSLPELVETMAEELLDWFDRPFAMFGHAGGGLIAFELAHFIRERFGLRLGHLFVEAAWAPDAWSGGNVGKVAKGPRTRQIGNLPRIGDWSGPYTYRPRPPLACPITALVGEDDEMLGREDLHRWSDFTRGGFRVESLHGGGDSYFAQPERLLRIVAQDLERMLKR